MDNWKRWYHFHFPCFPFIISFDVLRPTTPHHSDINFSMHSLYDEHWARTTQKTLKVMFQCVRKEISVPSLFHLNCRNLPFSLWYFNQFGRLHHILLIEVYEWNKRTCRFQVAKQIGIWMDRIRVKFRAKCVLFIQRVRSAVAVILRVKCHMMNHTIV